MSEFTWFLMLNNWYCWHGDEPVAILQYCKGYEEKRRGKPDTWLYWYIHRDSSGWSNYKYYSFVQMKQEIEKYYTDTINDPRKEITISRFERRVWNGEPWEDTVCDVYYVDRLTGKEVLRYDAADPANTNSHYGAESDYWKMNKRGYDLEQRIPAVLGR